MKNLALPRTLPLTTGCNQLINWGISFYMPGTFARAMTADSGWSSPAILFGPDSRHAGDGRPLAVCR